jgi:putative transposase
MYDAITGHTAAAARFIAEMVQRYFKDKQIVQEFTKPATPQQNSHIESYHSIMESAVCQKFEFSNISDAKKTMNQFRDFYNRFGAPI